MNSNTQNFDSKIKQSFNTLFAEVDDLISELKHKSSEEILNGSASKAQELISQVVPYENFYEKLKEAKIAFDNIEHNFVREENSDEIIEVVSQKDVDEEIKKKEVKNKEEETVQDNYTSQENFRIPILKALIFLGGSAEEVNVTEFVKKDMKNKLTKLDYEIPDGEDRERWLSSIYFETATMMDEGLLNNESPKKKWEIAQKGIDYLGKYGK